MTDGGLKPTSAPPVGAVGVARHVAQNSAPGRNSTHPTPSNQFLVLFECGTPIGQIFIMWFAQKGGMSDPPAMLPCAVGLSTESFGASFVGERESLRRILGAKAPQSGRWDRTVLAIEFQRVSKSAPARARCELGLGAAAPATRKSAKFHAVRNISVKFRCPFVHRSAIDDMRTGGG